MYPAQELPETLPEAHPEARPCLVLTDRSGELGWLGQFDDPTTARAAMADWLAATDRDPEDAAFILPILGFGRPATEG